MRAKQKPRCFVAMAFNQEDTDALYEEQIKPVLRRNDVTPIIVNRRQSNEDLNNQIYSQLLKCDFSIADLTYARPSVYFEAGFAERHVDVIYTVRKDHLKRGAPDDRRVHFDLQMKPLITWETATDPTFGTRLERRLLGTVLRDWRRNQKAEAAKKHAKEKFASMPVTDRIITIERKAVAILKDMGFMNWGLGTFFRFQAARARDVFAGRINPVLGSRVKKTTFEFATVQSSNTVKKTDLEYLRHIYRWYALESKIPGDGKDIKQVRAYHLVLSLQSIPPSRIESVFDKLNRVADLGHYVGVETRTHTMERKHDVEFIQDWNFIGSVRSPQELAERLLEIRGRVD
jgi:nucleoside 2-deoxyribosyltransferase